MKKIKALIVEDNYKSINLIKYLLTTYCPDVEVVAQAASLEEAIAYLQKLEIHLLLLDVHLHDRISFELFDTIDCTDYEVVFTTAYDQYAIKAFKYQAIDYILKPINVDDLIVAIERAGLRIQEKQLFQAQKLVELPKLKSNVKHLTIESLTKTNIINLDDIVYCESEGRYTSISLKNDTRIVASINLGKIEEMLNDPRFFRIHHSYIVNINFVVEITKSESVSCQMFNDVFLPVASRRRSSLKNHLQNYL